MFDLAVFAVAVLAGAVAAVAGFGIGSLLTPTVALHVDLKTAVAAVSLPHAVGTAIRLWFLRSMVSSRVLWTFGVASAAGGLAGAVLNAWASSRDLAIVFGVLLVFAGVSQLTGSARRWRFPGTLGWIAGIASGVFGGLVGNQGGIRAAALLGFDLTKEQFVATATAIALAVDAARVPVYLATEGETLRTLQPLIAVGTAGVVAGTLAGGRMLGRVPEPRFRALVGAIILLLGISVLIRGHA